MVKQSTQRDFSGNLMDGTEGETLNKEILLTHDGSMYGIYGNMDPINIPPLC